MRPYSCALLITVLLFAPGLSAADIGPALTGLTARGDDATSVFFSPAAITRLEKTEVVIQQRSGLPGCESFGVDSATVDGGNADND